MPGGRLRGGRRDSLAGRMARGPVGGWLVLPSAGWSAAWVSGWLAVRSMVRSAGMAGGRPTYLAGPYFRIRHDDFLQGVIGAITLVIKHKTPSNCDHHSSTCFGLSRTQTVSK